MCGWDNRQLAEDRLKGFEYLVLGEQINPHTRASVFEHTNISIPRNSNPEVAIRPSLLLDSLSALRA